MSHAGYLRDHHNQGSEPVIALIGGLYEAAAAAALLPRAAGLELLYERTDAWLASAAASFSQDRPLIRFGLRLALAPASMTAAHLEPLRDAGWSDREIHDAVHVVACFSYMNRLAAGLGVAVEQPDWAVALLGEARFAEHRRWAKGDPTG